MPRHDPTARSIEPTVSALSIEDDRAGRIRPAAAASSAPRTLLLALILLLAVAGGVALYWWLQQPAPAPAPPPVVEAPAAPAPRAEPGIRHPIEVARENVGIAATQPPLPPLSESDDALRQALAGIPGLGVFDRLFHPQDIVRRFVATVDNLPRKSVAAQVMAAKPVEGAFTVAGTGTVSIGPGNASRYTPYVRLAESVDTKTLVGVYVKAYPWFQQAYLDLGYPSGYFNDRLIDVIDLMLATPETSGPVALTQPRVLYEFADPRLEALPTGQKMMLRMGNENSARVKAKLREVRQALTAAAPR